MIQAFRIIKGKCTKGLCFMKKRVRYILALMLIFILLLCLIFYVNRPKISEGTSVENMPKQKIIEVPLICQYPRFPTGCEAVAATMVLNFYGENITAEKFAGDWLEKDSNFYKQGSKLYGPNPNEVFAGNPFSKNSYGCFAGPIVEAINKNSLKCFAEIISEKTIRELCKEYIDKNKPLLIWATMNMKIATEGNSWYFSDGTQFTWTAGEHCLVLVGYSEAYYFFNDPMTGCTEAFEKQLVEARFQELGKQAVYISKIT